MRGQSSGARVVPLNIETAKQLGGGARGRTLALIYRQLCYWSKYAKWRGSRNRKFFYKAQRELAEELGYSEKTISSHMESILIFSKYFFLLAFLIASTLYLQRTREIMKGKSNL